MRIASVFVLAGCYHYEPGTFDDLRPWPGEHVVLPCLDVAVEVGHVEPLTAPVVQYMFGNRCDHEVVLDFPAVQVRARTEDGRELHLAAYDPRHEIHADALPARLTGREAIAYDGDFAERPLSEVCVEIGALEHAAPRWICEVPR